MMNRLKNNIIFLIVFVLFFVICGTVKSDFVVNDQAKVALLREPYLQNSFADSISILWKTNIGKKSFVKYGKTKELGNTSYGVIEKDSAFIRHTVTLKGLERGEKYFYAIIPMINYWHLGMIIFLELNL